MNAAVMIMNDWMNERRRRKRCRQEAPLEREREREKAGALVYLEASQIFGVEMAFREQSEEDVRVREEGERATALGSWAREALAFLGAGELHSFLCLSVSSQRMRMHGRRPSPLFLLPVSSPLFPLFLTSPPSELPLAAAANSRQ